MFGQKKTEQKMEAKEEEIKRSSSPCYKKKEGSEGGIMADMRDHLEQFKNTSAEKHWICLKNTTKRAGNYIREKKQNVSLFGSRNAEVKETASTASK